MSMTEKQINRIIVQTLVETCTNANIPLKKKHIEEFKTRNDIRDLITKWNSKCRNISEYFFINIDGKQMPEEFFKAMYDLISHITPPINNDLSLKKYLSLKYMKSIYAKGIQYAIYLSHFVAAINPDEEINVYTSRDKLVYTIIYDSSINKFKLININPDSDQGTSMSYWDFMKVAEILTMNAIPRIQALEMDIDKYFYIKIKGRGSSATIESRSLINSSIIESTPICKTVTFRTNLNKNHTVREFDISQIFDGYKGLYHIIPEYYLVSSNANIQNIKVINDIISISANNIKGDEVLTISCKFLLFDKKYDYSKSVDNISIDL